MLLVTPLSEREECKEWEPGDAGGGVEEVGGDVGCGGGGGDEESVDQAPSRVFLSLGTAPPGGAFFVVGSALAEVMNEFGGGLGWNTTAEATSGSQENIRRLDSGELDFAMSKLKIIRDI